MFSIDNGSRVVRMLKFGSQQVDSLIIMTTKHALTVDSNETLGFVTEPNALC